LKISQEIYLACSTTKAYFIRTTFRAFC